MAEDINKVIIVGRLTRDSELKYTNSGTAVLSFSLAVNKSKKQGDQWVDEGHFFDVTVWGRRGESLANYLVKGQQIALEGALKQDRWQDQNGNNRSKVSIEVGMSGKVQLVGGKNEGGQSSGGNQNGQNRPQQAGGQDSYEDDIPF